MDQESNHAIVYGASGIIGWALVDQLLSLYPEGGTFYKVTAVTNRPINLSETYWPEKDSRTPSLQLVSGIDLRQGDGAALAGSLKKQIDIETITHVYYQGMFLAVIVHTKAYHQKSSPPLKMTSRKSRPIAICFRMSSTRTACLVPI
jgi:nucleoside-diphosphate-sugar epimerase